MAPRVGGRPVLRRGIVREFDEPRGLGVVVGTDGATYPFHCTELVDGSRRVEVGTEVVFVVAPAHLGRLEARQLAGIAVP